MMKSTVRTSGVAARLLQQAVAFRFCYNWAPLDPRKHTTMNHNPHNIYLDLYDYGHFPDWYHVCSTAPKTYQPQVVALLVSALNARYVSLPPRRAPTSMLNSCSPSASASGIAS
jgi:hypothetical protein